MRRGHAPCVIAIPLSGQRNRAAAPRIAGVLSETARTSSPSRLRRGRPQHTPAQRKAHVRLALSRSFTPGDLSVARQGVFAGAGAQPHGINTVQVPAMALWVAVALRNAMILICSRPERPMVICRQT